ncbi:MAG: C45 family peptidase [Planctomycetota bacterium]
MQPSRNVPRASRPPVASSLCAKTNAGGTPAVRVLAAFVLQILVCAAWCGEDLKVLARDKDGHGLLCSSQGKTLLFLEGSPQQMGAAHGRLLGPRVSKSVSIYYYLVGGVYSMNKDAWFITHLEEIEKRCAPFVPERFVAECDALAEASGLPAKTLRLTNLIPEQFHCSGVAVCGKASKDGQILHARVLDYMADIGLQKQALLTIFMPAGRNAWANVGYCGFVGSVTAMNDKGLAIGEMGGAGQGDWDGTPMSYLVRDIAERAAGVNEAIELFQKAKRTCEYYYVLSDKSGNLAALRCTASEVLVLHPGEQHELLPPVPEDTVFISGGDRAKELSKRLREQHGKIGLQEMIELLKRPVAMHSNLHNAIFAPATLDVWFADAGKHSPACDQPYAHVNLREAIEFYKKEMAAPAAQQ